MEIRSGKELIKASRELVESFKSRWENMNLKQDFDRMISYEEQLASSEIWDNAEYAQKITKQKNELVRKLEPWLELKKELIDLPELVELTLDEEGEAAISKLSKDYNKLYNVLENLELLGALNNPEDTKGAFLNIHPGAGGTESQDWAEMLLRMYTRYLENNGYKVSMIDYQPGDGAGIKNATLLVEGDYAFGYLKGEAGVHRLVRISPFDANKKRHTSFVSVHVSPDIEEDINIEIDEKDLKIDTYRSSGAGGQHVNTTDSAVRITHMPTGFVVQCQNERSQIKNRATAMKMLKARLYEEEMRKNKEDREKKEGDKKDIAWGSQIRSYVFHPYNLVKDHRTDYETGNVQAVMDGDLEPFIMAYLKAV